MKYSAEDAKKILEQENTLTLNSNKKGLRPVRHHYFGVKERPIDIREESPEGVVFFNLQVCYKNQGNVSEGTVEDVIWGFRQSGIPNDITWKGLITLNKLGYINFTNDIGIPLLGEPNPKMWYQWTDKYLNLLLANPSQTELEIDDRIKGKDTTIDRVSN